MMDLWATVPYYTAYLSKALLRDGVRVQIGSITYYLDRECFRGRGLRLDPGWLDVVGRLRLSRFLRRILKLVEGVSNLLVLAGRFSFRMPDVVHVQFLPLLRSRFPVDLWFVHFCRQRGAKVVLTVHDLLPHDTGETHRELYRGLYAKADALICHSAHIQVRLRDDFGVRPDKIAVIPHGPFFYDLASPSRSAFREALGLAPTQRFVLWQGIIFPYKGVDLLLAGWHEVEEREDSTVLVVLGTGEPTLLSSLQEQAMRLGLKRVRFEFRFCSAQELVAAYQEAAAVVYPYRAITTSGALATGLSLGKAIVASQLPVFEELLRDGDNALLVDANDGARLAEAILRILHEPHLAERLSAAVLDMRFGEQSWAEIATATEEVYREVLSGAKGQAGRSNC